MIMINTLSYTHQDIPRNEETLILLTIKSMFVKKTEFKKYMQFLSPKTQILEIENMINLLNKPNLPGYRINKKFRMLKN